MPPPYEVTPSASRLANSLRDIGYDLNTAVADLVDNSISADATRVDIVVQFEGANSYLAVADDGWGMSPTELREAMRFGTPREYREDELGRFGLGLKTASLSQGRRLTVVTRRSHKLRRVSSLQLDLDILEQSDRWEVSEPADGRAAEIAAEWLDEGPGTVVVIDKLDRLLPESTPESGYARRRLRNLADRLQGYLGMVFHRFLEDGGGRAFSITVNGRKVEPWNPFAPDEEHTLRLPSKLFEIDTPTASGTVRFTPYVLPSRRMFSSREAFERLSGPRQWNRQQGFYIYRADRMIQSGGWCGLRALDEHTKLARASLDFDPELDEVFRIDVAKMRAALPAQVRTLLERPVQELCNRANAAYRNEAIGQRQARSKEGPALSGEGLGRAIGASLISAATKTGDFDSLVRVLGQLRKDNPAIASALGW